MKSPKHSQVPSRPEGNYHIDIIDSERGIALIQLQGDISSQLAPLLLQEVDGLIKQGFIHLIVDLQEVTFMASCGVGTLFVIQQDVSALEGALHVVLSDSCAGEQVMFMLETGIVYRKICIHHDLEQAKGALKKTE